jgi:hypothetical protein
LWIFSIYQVMKMSCLGRFLSYEGNFDMSGKVNTHNCRIWTLKNPKASTELLRDTPNVNMFCGLSEQKIYGRSSLLEAPLQMLSIWTC